MLKLSVYFDDCYVDVREFLARTITNWRKRYDCTMYNEIDTNSKKEIVTSFIDCGCGREDARNASKHCINQLE